MVRFRIAEWKELNEEQKKDALLETRVQSVNGLFRLDGPIVVDGERLNAFCVLENEQPIAVLSAIAEAEKKTLRWPMAVSKYTGPNLAFFRFLKQATGEGRSPMQELFFRAMKWGLLRGCERLTTSGLTTEGRRAIDRLVKQGVIDEEWKINRERAPEPIDIESLQKKAEQRRPRERPKPRRRPPPRGPR